MPGTNHETQVLLMQDRPETPAVILRDTFGLDVPAYANAHTGCSDLTTFTPPDHKADQVTVLRDEDDNQVMAIITEIQQRKDDDKHYTWPLYAATLRERMRCPVHMLVICPDNKTSEWARTPIGEKLESLQLHVSALGPDNAPVVDDAEEARRMPSLSVLSAAMHHENHRVLDAAQAALDTVPEERMRHYHKFIEAHLDQAASQYWRKQMQTEQYGWQSEIARGFRAEGEAKAILMLLDDNGVDLTEHQRDTIRNCTDIDQLNTWLKRAAKATHARDVLTP